MVIGGLVCSPADKAELREYVRKAREPLPDTLKWERVRDSNLHRYTTLMDRFFAMSRDQAVDLCAVVFDTHRVDHRTHNNGDAELGFHKWIAQHLLSHSRSLGRHATFECFYAERSSRRWLQEVKDAVNNMARIHYRDGAHRVVRLEYREYKREPIFQIADILIGAIGCAWNQTHKAGPKAELMNHIRRSAGLATLAEPTSWERRNFDIWEFQLRDGPRA